MPGYDDPRFLQQKIEKLEHDLKNLRAVSLPFLVHQRGAVPGTMRAVQIGDVSQKSSMWMNLVGNQPGQAPYQAVTDSAGTVRAEMGNLAARGSSPAQFGFRSNDASGNPIFDTIGLFGDRVMKNLGIGNGNNQSFTTTTFTAITNASVTFTIAANRPPANIFAPFLATGRVNTNNGNVGQVRANLVGVTTSGNLNFGVLANFAQTSTGWIFVTGLAAGTYTCQLEGNVNATPQTCDIFSNTVQVFQLGG